PIILEEDPSILNYKIVVTDYIVNGIEEGKSPGSIELNYEQLSRNNSLVEHDVLKSVQLLPGISSTDESAANLSIRGSSPDQNLILWEGVSLYDPGHFFGMIASINPFTLKSIDTYKGIFNPSYDSRIGGLIDISLEDEVQNEWSGSIGTTFTEGHFYSHVPLVKDKLSVLLGVRNTTWNVFESPTLESYGSKVFQGSKLDDEGEEEEENYRDGDEFLNYYDINSKIIFQANEQIKFQSSLYKQRNKFNVYALIPFYQIESEDNWSFDSEAWSNQLDIQWSPVSKTHFQHSISNYKSEYLTQLLELQDLSIIQSNDFSNSIKDQKFILNHNWKLNRQQFLDIAYTLSQLQLSVDLSETSSYENDFSEFNEAEGTFHSLAASLQSNKERLQLMAGLKASYANNTDNIYIAPRLNLQYKLNQSWKLKFGIGRFYQFISQIKNFDGSGIDNKLWVLNDSFEASPIQGDKVNLGFTYNKKSLLIDIDLYANRSMGLLSASNTISNSLAFDNLNTSAYGLEFLLRKRWRNYSLWLNYNLSSTKYFTDDIDPFPASNDQLNRLSIVNTFKIKNWNLALIGHYKTGLPFTSASSFELEYDDEDDEAFFELQYEGLNTERLKDYVRLDFQLGYSKLFLKDKARLEFQFSIINLLNHDNIFSQSSFLSNLEDDEE
ncbi:MAG: TonB-dependent receptor plug domain-containing protein, partial [Bacteroidota bacterium]